MSTKNLVSTVHSQMVVGLLSVRSHNSGPTRMIFRLQREHKAAVEAYEKERQQQKEEKAVRLPPKHRPAPKPPSASAPASPRRPPPPIRPATAPEPPPPTRRFTGGVGRQRIEYVVRVPTSSIHALSSGPAPPPYAMPYRPESGALNGEQSVPLKERDAVHRDSHYWPGLTSDRTNKREDPVNATHRRPQLTLASDVSLERYASSTRTSNRRVSCGTHQAGRERQRRKCPAEELSMSQRNRSHRLHRRC